MRAKKMWRAWALSEAGEVVSSSLFVTLGVLPVRSSAFPVAREDCEKGTARMVDASSAWRATSYTVSAISNT